LSIIISEGFEGTGYENEGDWVEDVDGGDCLINEDYTYASAGSAIGFPIPGGSPGSQVLLSRVDDWVYNTAVIEYNHGSDVPNSHVRFYTYVAAEDFFINQATTISRLSDYGVGECVRIKLGKDSVGTGYLMMAYYSDGAMASSSPYVPPGTIWFRIEYKYSSSSNTWEFRVNDSVIDSGSLTSPRTADVCALGGERHQGSNPGTTDLLMDLFEWRDDGFPGVDLEFSDGIKLGDTTIGKLTKIFSDGIKLGETIGRKLTKTFSDGIKLVDTTIRKLTRIFSDGIKLGETIGRKLTKTFSDGIKLGETVGRKLTRIFSDGIKLGETIGRKLTRIFSDGIRCIESSIDAYCYYHSSGVWTGVLKWIRNLLPWDGVVWTEKPDVSDGWIKGWYTGYWGHFPWGHGVWGGGEAHWNKNPNLSDGTTSWTKKPKLSDGWTKGA